MDDYMKCSDVINDIRIKFKRHEYEKGCSYSITALEDILLRIHDANPSSVVEILSIVKQYENEMDSYVAAKYSPPDCFIVARDVAISLQEELRCYYI